MSERETPGLDRLPQGLLAAAVEACPVGLSIRDGGGRIVAANSAAAQAFASGDNAAETSPRVSFDWDGRAWTVTPSVDRAEQDEAQRRLLKLAYIDSLTGLPNRLLLEEHIGELIGTAGQGDMLGVAFIDLDNFKYVNDYYGHYVGDQLLQKVADRAASFLRPSDMLARVGGDEFVLLVSPAEDLVAVHSLVAALAERLKQPFYIDGDEIFASASTGISIFPQHGEDFDTLRRHADSAMYKVKQKAKGGVLVFNREISAEATSRMEVEQRLRLAIRDRRVCCAYQPKVDMRTGRVCGVEVLLRWRDDDGLIQAPGEFVNLAVELGLINEIAFRVLTETVRSLPILDKTYGPGTTLSLNVAAKQAGDLAFMSDFIDSIVVTGLADRFMLELTEEAFFTAGPFQTDVMPLLRRSGLRVSIDDFGVGYSSLGSLADIHADELKIDRSFITDIHLRPRSQVVLRAIDQLGHSLDMKVVAEGVETREEAAYLMEKTDVRIAQGFLFGRPAVIAEQHTDDLVLAEAS